MVLRFIIIVPLFFLTNMVHSQSFSFDYPLGSSQDIDVDPFSIWQIARPNKNMIDSATSAPNVMITDSINSYPINDTSVFILRGPVNNLIKEFTTGALGVFGRFYSDCDSLNDFGFVSFRKNGGVWYDLSEDSLRTLGLVSYLGVGDGRFTGRSSSWGAFTIYVNNLALEIGVENLDTVEYMFTFVSDSVFDNRDGLAFDDIGLIDLVANIQEYEIDDLVCYPSPVSSTLKVQLALKSNYYSLLIHSQSGDLVRTVNVKGLDLLFSNVSDLPIGTYFVTVEGKRLGRCTFVKAE